MKQVRGVKKKKAPTKREAYLWSRVVRLKRDEQTHLQLLRSRETRCTHLSLANTKLFAWMKQASEILGRAGIAPQDYAAAETLRRQAGEWKQEDQAAAALVSEIYLRRPGAGG